MKDNDHPPSDSNINVDTALRLAKEGRKKEAFAMLEELKEKAKYHPTEIRTLKNGTLAFYSRRKRVVPDPEREGYWKPLKGNSK